MIFSHIEVYLKQNTELDTAAQQLQAAHGSPSVHMRHQKFWH